MDQVKEQHPGLAVRVAFVGYRDYGDNERFSLMDFTEAVNDVKEKIKAQTADGGGDTPEDVQGAFHKALRMSWNPDSIKNIVFISDAPGHGFWRYDDFPNGLPEGYKLEDQMNTFADQKIRFTFLKLDSNCDKMIKAM